MASTVKEFFEDGELCIEQELLDHQYEFCADIETPVLGLASGYGGGKTFCLSLKHVQLMFHNAGVDSIFAEPTNALLVQLAFPAIEYALKLYGVEYKLVKSPVPIYTCIIYDENNQPHLTRLVCCSMENYKRLIGLNCSHISLDEFDTTEQKIAYKAFERFLGRLRKGSVRQMNIVSTPEGFRAMYQIFVADLRKKPYLKDMRRIIHARTTDNPYVPKSFIENMRMSYSPQLVDAYIEGRFVNMKEGVIYHQYDTTLSGSNEQILPNEDLHVGQDFNVQHMASAIFVIREAMELVKDWVIDPWTDEEVLREEWQPVEHWHCVAEIAGGYDTESTIKELIDRYQTGDRHHNIIIYPDASGKNRKTVNASTSDIAMLEAAGFECRYHAANPAVRDRINAVNSRFNAGGVRRLFVNELNCPEIADCLRRQGWNEKGEPEKGGENDPSHMNDAFGYPIVYNFPLELHYSGAASGISINY